MNCDLEKKPGFQPTKKKHAGFLPIKISDFAVKQNKLECNQDIKNQP